MYERNMKIKSLITSILLAACFTANAQNQEAFKHLGIGVEAGLMGFGVQVATPIVDNHIMAVLGVNFYGFSASSGKFYIDKEVVNDGISRLHREIDDDIADHPDHTDYRHTRMLENDMMITPKLKLGSDVKVLFEYYPWRSTGFHITAGVMIGCGDILSVSARADDASQAIFKDVFYNQDVYNRYEHGTDYSSYEDFIYDNLRFNLDDDRTFLAYDKDRKELETSISLSTNKVKPYFGIGWGRSVPRRRLSFQFEMGAWYHGKPTIKSSFEVPYDRTSSEGITGVTKILNKVQFYPQLTFRLSGRIF